jgi:hypothetical protein
MVPAVDWRWNLSFGTSLNVVFANRGDCPACVLVVDHGEAILAFVSKQDRVGIEAD